MKVVVCGPPHSGKSTFTACMIQVIRERKRNRSYNISFTWMPLDVTDNSLAALVDTDDEVEQKRDVEWSQERAEERQAMFEGRDERLVLADAPGKITDELQTVIQPADAVIVLASREKEDMVEDWKLAAKECGLDIFAELTTVLEDDIGAGWLDRQERQGVLRSIERAEFEQRQIDALEDPTRRVVKQLVTDLLKECEAED
ncbi:hypothetical protein [Haloarcula amylolytica]|nr:hypothetical protein [Haloarcula amylolytica]